MEGQGDTPAKLSALRLIAAGILSLLALLMLEKLALSLFFLAFIFIAIGANSKCSESQYWFLLGAFTPLAAVVQIELLIFLVLLYSLKRPEVLHPSLLVHWPFYGFLLITILGVVWSESSNYSIWAAEILSSDTWIEAIRVVRATFREQTLPALDLFVLASKYLIFLSLLSGGGTLRVEREAYLRGLIPGSIPALLLVFFESLWPDLHAQLVSNEHWLALGRSTGGFADPNAFGIFAFLMLAICHYWYRLLGGSNQTRLKVAIVFIAGLWLLFAPFSGSRSFFLGLACYLLFLFFFHSKYLFLLTLVSLSFVVFFVNFIGAENLAEYASFAPGTQRLLQALDYHSLSETFASRFIFWRIALEVWLDNIVYGVGLTRFPYFVVSYAEHMQLGTQFWTDNANSFYLGLLAETGLVGIILIGLIVSSFSLEEHWKSRAEPYKVIVATALSFFILLFFGPHLYFVQVLIPTAFFLSMIVSVRERILPSCGQKLAIGLMYCFVGVKVCMPDSYGGYHWERSGQERIKWLRPASRVMLRCVEKESSLRIRIPRPGIHLNPVRIAVYDEHFSRIHQITVADHQIHELRVPCSSGRNWPEAADSPIRVFTIEASDAFIPILERMRSEDLRLLSLQIIDRRPFTLL